MSPFERIVLMSVAISVIVFCFMLVYAFRHGFEDALIKLVWMPLGFGLMMFFLLNGIVMHGVLAPWPDVGHMILSGGIFLFTVGMLPLFLQGVVESVLESIGAFAVLIALQYGLAYGGEWLIAKLA